MFKVSVIGNIGGDAEVKNDNGRQYVQFSVADTRKFTKEDGTKQEITNWISCFYRNADSEVVKYLKKGTRVFVRGNGELRLFSSAKDRMMKAGCSINVQEIELVGGGSSDEVPRELSLPTGQILPVYKAFFIDVRNMNEVPTELYDRKGVSYNVDANGYITPPQSKQQSNENGMVQEQSEESTTNESQPEIF